MKNNELSEKFLLNKINPSWNDFFFEKFGAEKLEVLLVKLDKE